MPRPLNRFEQLQLAVAAECDPRTVVRWLAGLQLTDPTQKRLDTAATKLGFIGQTTTATPAAITAVKPPRA